MSNFTTRQEFLFFSYTMLQNEQEKIDKFLKLLEKSGVCKLINKHQNSNRIKGGRPLTNACDILSTILYCFAFGSGSLRDIEEKITFDLRGIYLMNNEKVSYKTFGNFINDVILPNRYEIFSLITKAIFDECQIKMDKAYVDGSKFEADANKYKFVWKPTKYHENLSNNVRELLSRYNLDRGISSKGIIESVQIAKKLNEFNELNKNNNERQVLKDYKSLVEFLNKSLEYEEKERICGPDRNSYFKTDNDATAMCLKEDFYSGLGSNMHAAYNTQIMVFNGLIACFIVTQSRSDISDFIPLLIKHNELYDSFPKSVCADAGYGSLKNYEFLNEHKIENFVKHQSWEGNASGKNPSTYRLNDDLTISCLNNNIGTIIEEKPWHPKKKDGVFYKIEGCNDCKFNAYCKRFMNDKTQNYKYFEVSTKMQHYIQQAETNLLSIKGIEMRVNRSAQVEGAFGVIKQDIQFERFRRTSKEKVETEFMLTVLGYNIRKLFKYFSGNLKAEYWKAPENITEEHFKKPSAKRLENKVKKKKSKSINKLAKSSYKYKKKGSGSSK